MKPKDDSEDVADAVRSVQEGDQEALLNALKGRIISPVAVDGDGCSLLHWAALNNRLAICRLLLAWGADPTQTGGVLNENPLQWAIRKKYMAMAKVLVNWTNEKNIMLKHKSKLGNDALHLAIRQFDSKQVFLLLHFGADPNSVDSDNNTPLLWMVKNCKGHGKRTNDGKNTKGIVRLLLRFGCDSSIVDNDMCNALHILAKDTEFNAEIAFLIFQNMNDSAKYATDREGLNSRILAIHSNNPRFVQFYIDYHLFSFLPYHIVTFVGIITMISLPTLVHIFDFYLGLFYTFLVWFILAQVGFQWTIHNHQDRVPMGITIGTIISMLTSYRWYVSTFTDSFSSFLFLCSFCLSLFLAAKFVISKPFVAKPGDPNEIAEKIVQASIGLGPDGNDDFKDINSSSSSDFTIIKNLDNNASIKKHQIRLCTSCLSDKAPTTSHCKYCDACILDCDRHVNVLGNCIGRGNTYLFTILLLSTAWTFFLYVYISVRSLRIALCPDAKGILWNTIAVQSCISEIFPGASVMIMISIMGFLYCIALVNMQIVWVTRHTTTNLVRKKKYMLYAMNWTLYCSRLIRFFQSGVNEIKVYEKENETDEYDNLLNDEVDNDDDFSDNESTHKYIRESLNHQHSQKCKHHHHTKEKIIDTITATKTATIAADERV